MLGDFIKQRRLELGMTQEDLAHKTVGIGIKKTPPHLLRGERAKGERQEYIVRVIHPSDLHLYRMQRNGNNTSVNHRRMLSQHRHIWNDRRKGQTLLIPV